MYANTGCTNMAKMGHSWLRIDQRGRWHSKGVNCDILTQGNMVVRILIPPKYTFFFGSPTVKNSRVKCTCLRAILGWVNDREIFLCVYK
jgi:hypothetical protein